MSAGREWGGGSTMSSDGDATPFRIAHISDLHCGDPNFVPI